MPTPPSSSAGPESRPRSTAPQRLRDVRVLVVDDDADQLDLACHVLRSAGAIVTAELSSMTAAALELSFDVWVLDLIMPSLDGAGLLGRLRARSSRPLPPAIALSASASSQDIESAIAAGFDAHVAKPYEPEDLVLRVAELSGAAGS